MLVNTTFNALLSLDEKYVNIFNICLPYFCGFLLPSVITVDRRTCHSHKPVAVPGNSGYLASVTAHETGCGSADAPWVIEVPAGQKINITLFDFGMVADNQSHVDGGGSRVCRVYATIREEQGGRSVTVCGGESRIRTVYLSLKHKVEVRLISTKNAKPSHFLLHYQGGQNVIHYYCMYSKIRPAIYNPGNEIHIDGSL